MNSLLGIQRISEEDRQEIQTGMAAFDSWFNQVSSS